MFVYVCARACEREREREREMKKMRVGGGGGDFWGGRFVILIILTNGLESNSCENSATSRTVV